MPFLKRHFQFSSKSDDPSISAFVANFHKGHDSRNEESRCDYRSDYVDQEKMIQEIKRGMPLKKKREISILIKEEIIILQRIDGGYLKILNLLQFFVRFTRH